MKERYLKEENTIAYTDRTHPFGRTEGEMPELATKRERFFYWFKNVFLYHYRWQTACGLVILILAAFFVRDIFAKTTPDFQFVAVSNAYISDEHLAEMTAIASSIFKNPDTDEGGNCFGHGMYMGAEGEWAMAMYTKLSTFFVDAEVRFFIFDYAFIDPFFDTPEGFIDLAERGYPAESGKPWLIELTGRPLAERGGFAGAPCFAAIQAASQGLKNIERSDAQNLAFLDAILNTP